HAHRARHLNGRWMRSRRSIGSRMRSNACCSNWRRRNRMANTKRNHAIYRQLEICFSRWIPLIKFPTANAKDRGIYVSSVKGTGTKPTQAEVDQVLSGIDLGTASEVVVR